MKTEKWSRFEISDYLATEEDLVAYLQNAIESGDRVIIEDAFKIVESTRKDFFGMKNALRELYYFQRITNEFDEKTLVEELIPVLQLKNNYSYAKASSDAGSLISALLELLSGKDIFKTVHENINK